ncbi:MAG: NYN domain-containing protein [Firmicutes bacterium]|nr:NYN domain-containing protein [Bacillota bacterium]
MDRLIAYIDGFNLYFGMKDKGWRRYYWLNLQKLRKNLLKSNQKLITTKYFTARITDPPDKQKRQSAYIEALSLLNDFEIFLGKYQLNKWECASCHSLFDIPNEKMTDVNIAVELLTDAFQDNFDVALVISADSDLVAPIKKTKELFPSKRIIIAFPPKRHSVTLAKAADASFTIGRKKLASSLFPQKIKKPDGYIIECPERWLKKE